MGGRPGFQNEVPHAKEPEARWRGGRHQQEARLKVLPAEDRHTRTGQYLHWAKVRPTTPYWWCQCPSQTRGHFFKRCSECRMQQKICGWRCRRRLGGGRGRTVRDLLADGRCGQAVLDFLSSTDVGRFVPPPEEGEAGGEVSEWEHRERREREEELEAEVEELGAAGELGAGGSCHSSYPCPPSWHPQTRSRILGTACFVLSFAFPLSFPGCALHLLGTCLGRGRRGVCNMPPPRGQRTGIFFLKCTPP